MRLGDFVVAFSDSQLDCPVPIRPVFLSSFRFRRKPEVGHAQKLGQISKNASAAIFRWWVKQRVPKFQALFSWGTPTTGKIFKIMRFVFCPLGGAKRLENFAPPLGVDKKFLADNIWLQFGRMVVGDVLSLTSHFRSFRTRRFP